AIDLVFETHSITVDNEEGRATGWWAGRLSGPSPGPGAPRGGAPRGRGGRAAVCSSDLTRAAETASVAFGASGIPVLLDWRLRECDYGKRNGMPVAELHANPRDHLDRAYPGGESWRQAVERVGLFLNDLPLRWDGQRVLVIGHVATRWALDH